MTVLPKAQTTVDVAVSVTKMSIPLPQARTRKISFVPCPDSIVAFWETLHVQLRPRHVRHARRPSLRPASGPKSS